MEEKSLLIQFMGDTPISRIIDFLVENKGLDFSKTQVAEGAKISRTALFTHWETIKQFELATVTRTFGKTKLYTLNMASPLVLELLNIEFKLIEYSMRSELEATNSEKAVELTVSGS